MAEQQRHRRVIGPGAWGKIEGSASDEIADRSKAPRSRQLRRRGERLAERKPE
jgi:hypothetical protein